MVYFLMAGLLVPMAVEDIKKQHLNLKWILLMGVWGIGVNIIWGGWGLCDIAAGGVTGMILMLISRINGSIGTGDGFLFLSAGLICGWEKCLLLLTGSLCCCLPVSLFLKFVKHKPGKYTIPFAPFVLFAWLCQMILQAGR